MNATWWVRYYDANDPSQREHLLSLASPDLANVKKATKRAADTAKLRLRKRGMKPVIQSVRCVG